MIFSLYICKSKLLKRLVMEQKRKVNQKAVRIFAVLISAAGLFLTATLAACSSDEDDNIPAEKESIEDFFKKTLPQEQEGSGTDVKDVPFTGFDKQENVCVVINSYDELKTIYQGNNPLPEVDFSKYSLIIGRAWINVGYKFKNLTISEDNKGNSVVTLHFTVLYDATLAMVTYYYYWVLCPKFSPTQLDVKIETVPTIPIANRRIPYQPMEVSAMPAWLAKQVNEYAQGGMHVNYGTWNGQPIYDVYATFMSSAAGMCYDKDGNFMPGGVEYFYEVDDWKCIYYSTIGGGSLF